MVKRIGAGPRMSSAVVANGMVYTSGQVDDSAGIAAQTQAILAKIDALLAAAGTDKSAAVSANIWLANMDDFAAMNAVWDTWVTPGSTPARATVQSRLAGPQYLVEIAIVAVIP
jgi:enamine deaminase RidA (YjgF/YER057c/UK114 family)